MEPGPRHIPCFSSTRREWHLSHRLVIPHNITIVPLPPKCAELNRSRTFGNSCGTTGSQTASSRPTRKSSTIAAMHGTNLLISLGPSCPSDCANGHIGSNQWASVSDARPATSETLKGSLAQIASHQHSWVPLEPMLSCFTQSGAGCAAPATNSRRAPIHRPIRLLSPSTRSQLAASLVGRSSLSERDGDIIPVRNAEAHYADALPKSSIRRLVCRMCSLLEAPNTMDRIFFCRQTYSMASRG